MSLASTLIRSAFAADDRQHAGAGAEVEHAPRAIRLEHVIEQQQAAARGAVVAGAERQRRLDLDAELVGRHFGAVMPAVHDEAPGADRDQLFERRLDPVLGFHGVEGDVLRDLVAGGETDQLADRDLIRRLGKMHGDVPAPAGPLERGDRGLALEKALGQEIDHALGGCSSPMAKARAVGGGGEGGGHRGSVAGKAAG